MSDTALKAYRDAREDQLVRNEARHIRSKINDARGSRHDAGVRWPFELLQNAIDAGPRPGRDLVDVWLRQDGNRFLFEHDGAFFTVQDLAALLSGGSSKDFESKDTTGRFGTGFLVTHVLAPRTNVAGIFSAENKLECFALELDRDGDEESIVANIEACDAAIRAARPLAEPDGIPSASFEYVTDDVATLERGMTAFRDCVPYLFATCERLGRVGIEVSGGVPETWEASPIASRTDGDALVHERVLSCRRNNRITEYRAIRVAAVGTPNAHAIAVLVQQDELWRVLVPSHEFPRVFCRYPIRSSAFLPINVVLDAPFDLDQERRRILFDKDAAKTLFHAAIGAAVPLILLAFDKGWKDCHWLARAAPSPSSFADKEDKDEQGWLTGEMECLAEQLARLPLIDTRNGRGAAVTDAGDTWFADFVDTDTDGTTMARLWPLVEDVEVLYPPVSPLAEAWGTIARGWHALGVNVNLIGLESLGQHARGEDAAHIDELRLRCDKRDWLARFLDVVGECWATMGTNVDLLDGLLPNQHGELSSLANLKQDEGIPDELKEIAEALDCNVRSRLFDRAILSIATERSLEYVESALNAAVPAVMTEDDVLEECVRVLEKKFPKSDRLSDSNQALVLASIRLLDYLALRPEDVAPLASRVPLLAREGTFARTSVQRKMMSPVDLWDERARAFYTVYPPERVLAPEYVGTNVVTALVDWGMAFPDPLTTIAPTDPIKEDRLRCLAIDGQDTNGVQLQGEEFTQIALLHELIPHCQGREEAAAALLGLALSYAAPADPAWRETREVVGRRGGADVRLTVRGALWLADLRARAWVPVRGDEGKMSQVMPTAESLRSLLDPTWLQGNRAALELLGDFFGFDALDLQLLAAPDEQSRQELRDRLAHLVELTGADPALLLAVEHALQEKQRRARDVNRCRTFGLAVQAAIKLALEEHGLAVKLVDVGYDFEVSYNDLDDAAATFVVDSYLVEVKATTQGDAKLTPKQAEAASQQVDRYVLCVVDLRGVSEKRLDQPWAAEDVLSLAYMVPQVGDRIRETWELVDEATSSEVALRNDSALRYAVPPAVWETGCSISEWAAAAFQKSGV